MSAGWSFYIVALTAINIIGLIWLLLATAALVAWRFTDAAHLPTDVGTD